MEESSLLSAIQRDRFLDNFFGRLVIEHHGEKFRVYFPDQPPDSVDWIKSSIVSRGGGVYGIEYAIGGVDVIREITMEGDCFRVAQPELGFDEWFCREPHTGVALLSD